MFYIYNPLHELLYIYHYILIELLYQATIKIRILVIESKANKVEAMSKRVLYQLKYDNGEQFDKVKILNNGHKQLLTYTNNLNKHDYLN